MLLNVQYHSVAIIYSPAIINTLLYMHCVVFVGIEPTLYSVSVRAHSFLVQLLVDSLLLGFTCNYTLLPLIMAVAFEIPDSLFLLHFLK